MKEYKFKLSEKAQTGFHGGLKPWDGYFKKKSLKEGVFNGKDVEKLLKSVEEMEFPEGLEDLAKVFAKYDKDNGTRWSRPLQIESEKIMHDIGMFKRSITRMIENMLKERNEVG